MFTCGGVIECFRKALLHQEFMGNVESIVTMLAILVGAWWTYSLFVRQRQRFPRATISHTVRHAVIGNAKRLVQIGVEVRNIGTTMIRVSDVDVRLQYLGPFTPEQVAAKVGSHPPLTENSAPQIPWPLLGRRKLKIAVGEREIEPGEPDVMHFDFIIDDSAEVIRVYSHVQNRSKRRRWQGWRLRSSDIGWTTATFHELKDRQAETQSIVKRFRRKVPRRVVRRATVRALPQGSIVIGGNSGDK